MLCRCRRLYLWPEQETIRIFVMRYARAHYQVHLCTYQARTRQAPINWPQKLLTLLVLQHGGPNEHKGPADFNGGADEEDEDDENGTPQPNGLPQHFHGQPGGYPHQLRNHTPSASPPIQNGMMFHGVQRGHTPQPHPGSRPGSRNDIRRMGSNLVAPQVGGPYGPPQGHPQGHHQGHPQGHMQGHPQGHPHGPHVNGYAYVTQPAMYNPQNAINMSTHQYRHHPPPHMQMHMEQQRQSSVPPNFPPQNGPQQPSPPQPARHSLSPPQHRHGLPSAPLRRPSPPPQRSQMQTDQEAMPAPTEPISDQNDRLAPPDAASAIKKLPQRKQHSIFTPIDENRSVLFQHLLAFADMKNEHSRVPSFDAPAGGSRITASPPQSNEAEPGPTSARRQVSVSSIPDQTHTPPSRANSLRVGGGASRPRLKVQIPDEPSEAGSNTAESTSAGQHSTDATSQTTRNDGSHSSGIKLPPPSPSAATTLLSAGATGPPNPFARPPPSNPPHNHSLMETPASALPSRYMNNDFLPSPSQFFADSYPRHHESNTLPSPLNFATPVVGSGPSFLREEMAPMKRKSPETHFNAASDPVEPGNESKRLKIEN